MMQQNDLPLILMIRKRCWEEMHTHVVQSSSLPNIEEVCGLVAGKDNVAMAVIPVTNELHSPVRYRMDPAEQLRAFQWIESQGMELLAIYHSHPQGIGEPSETDLEEATYPEAVYLIWFFAKGEWHCRGFVIRNRVAKEILIKITD